MERSCDHKSVGILVWKNDKLLLIERKKPPFGYAPPAGHVDIDNSFEDAAIRELREEVGIEAENLKLLAEGRKDNPCRRQDGTWHYWKIYAVGSKSRIKRSEEETKQAGFLTKQKLWLLAKKTERYLNGDIGKADWKKTPGLEPVWYDWLKQLKII